MIRVDPKTGDPATPVTGLVRTTGHEVGVRSERPPGLQSSLAVWRLNAGSELLFVGDAGTTEASRPSRRQGVEWSNRYQPLRWLSFDLDFAVSHARFTDADPAGDRIPRCGVTGSRRPRSRRAMSAAGSGSLQLLGDPAAAAGWRTAAATAR